MPVINAPRRARLSRIPRNRDVGLSESLVALLNRDNLSLSPTGKLTHLREYAENVMESGSKLADANDAREFAAYFLQRSPIYSNSPTGVAAAAFESRLFEKMPDVFNALLETQVKPGDTKFMAVFTEPVEAPRIAQLKTLMETICTFTVPVKHGDVRESAVSDLTIFECTPSKKSEQAAGAAKVKKDEPTTPDAKSLSKEEYQEVKESGGVANDLFRYLMGCDYDIYEAAKDDGPIAEFVDGGGVLWRGDGIKWIPIFNGDEPENLDEAGAEEFTDAQLAKLGYKDYSIQVKSADYDSPAYGFKGKGGKYAWFRRNFGPGKEYGKWRPVAPPEKYVDQSVNMMKLADQLKRKTDESQIPDRPIVEPRSIVSQFATWAARGTDIGSRIFIGESTYDVDRPLMETYRLVDKVYEQYDTAAEADLMIEQSLRELCEAEGEETEDTTLSESVEVSGSLVELRQQHVDRITAMRRAAMAAAALLESRGRIDEAVMASEFPMVRWVNEGRKPPHPFGKKKKVSKTEKKKTNAVAGRANKEFETKQKGRKTIDIVNELPVVKKAGGISKAFFSLMDREKAEYIDAGKATEAEIAINTNRFSATPAQLKIIEAWDTAVDLSLGYTTNEADDGFDEARHVRLSDVSEWFVAAPIMDIEKFGSDLRFDLSADNTLTIRARTPEAADRALGLVQASVKCEIVESSVPAAGFDAIHDLVFTDMSSHRSAILTLAGVVDEASLCVRDLGHRRVRVYAPNESVSAWKQALEKANISYTDQLYEAGNATFTIEAGSEEVAEAIADKLSRLPVSDLYTQGSNVIFVARREYAQPHAMELGEIINEAGAHLTESNQSLPEGIVPRSAGEAAIEEATDASLNKDRRKLSVSLVEIGKGYHSELPLDAMRAAVKSNGFATEDFDGIYTGREGRATIDVGRGTKVVFSWYKMASGKYEVVPYVA